MLILRSTESRLNCAIVRFYNCTKWVLMVNGDWSLVKRNWMTKWVNLANIKDFKQQLLCVPKFTANLCYNCLKKSLVHSIILLKIKTILDIQYCLFKKSHFTSIDWVKTCWTYCTLLYILYCIAQFW